MSLIVKRVIEASSLVCQAVLHVFLRDFTNYYWYRELEERSRLTEIQNIPRQDEALISVTFKTEESGGNTTELVGGDSNIEEYTKNKDYSHETVDESSNNYGNVNTLTKKTLSKTCKIVKLGDCVPRDDSEKNHTQELVCGTITSDNEVNGYFGGDLSESIDNLKGTSLKPNLSYIVVAAKSDGDSLKNTKLNNENSFGESTRAIPAIAVLEEHNCTLENLKQQVDNEYESLNDLTVCFKDVASKDPPESSIYRSPAVSEAMPVDDVVAEIPLKCGILELTQSEVQIPTFNSQHDKHSTSKTNSTESLTINTDTAEAKPNEDTLPTDSIWSIDTVQEKIQNLLSALTSNVNEKNPEKPAQKNSDTSDEDSDNETETYDELVKKVLSGTKSDGEMSPTEENSCTCTAQENGLSCLQVVEFDEAYELLTQGQMSSVDTGSVSDWLYSVTPAICLPSTSSSTVETSEDPLRIHEKNKLNNIKHFKYREEIISRTIFTNKWVGETKKYCTS